MENILIVGISFVFAYLAGAAIGVFEAKRIGTSRALGQIVVTIVYLMLLMPVLLLVPRQFRLLVLIGFLFTARWVVSEKMTALAANAVFYIKKWRGRIRVGPRNRT